MADSSTYFFDRKKKRGETGEEVSLSRFPTPEDYILKAAPTRPWPGRRAKKDFLVRAIAGPKPSSSEFHDGDVSLS